MSRLIPLLLLLLAVMTHAKDFSQYCGSTSMEKDCSAEFLQALNDASSNAFTLRFSPADSYLIKNINTQGMGLAGVTLEGGNLVTNKLWLSDISQLTITDMHITGLATEQVQQPGALVLVGGKGAKAYNIYMKNITIEKAAEDLLVVVNAGTVTVKGSTLLYPGLAQRLHDANTSDPRPRGSNLLLSGVSNVTIEDNIIKHARKVGIYISSGDSKTSFVTIVGNRLNLLNENLPSKRYGELGGNGIYLDQTMDIDNVVIESNEIKNYRTGGIRINGSNITVTRNHFNRSIEITDCKIKDDDPGVRKSGTAVKGHYLDQVTISDNCVHNTLTGFHISAWGLVSNMQIFNNVIVDGSFGIYLDNNANGLLSNIGIFSNLIYGFNRYAIAFVNTKLATENYVIGNTISNGNPARKLHSYGFAPKKFQGPAVVIKNQRAFTYQNNWLYGVATSVNWSHVILENITQSSFFRNALVSPIQNDVGGFQIIKSVAKEQIFDNHYRNVPAM